MNKKDVLLIFVVLIISLLFIFKPNNNNNNNNKYALVYYEDKVILKVKLDKHQKYSVKGYLGDVIIETDIGKVRVSEETSKYHLCSKQGYVSNNVPIVCLPNKIIIKIEEESELDAVV